MAILVDYTCRSCGGRSERWIASPPPETVQCAACLSDARRVFAFAGLAEQSVAPHHGTRHDRQESEGGDSLPSDFVVKNSDVPGICHLGPSAARRWVAMARQDRRAEEAEIAYQEKAIADGTLTTSDAFVH